LGALAEQLGAMVSNVVHSSDSAGRPRVLRLGCAFTLLLITVLSGCSESSEPERVSGPLGYCGEATAGLVSGSGTPAEPLPPRFETAIAESACGAVEREYEPETAPAPSHLDPCAEVAYPTNPPCLGPHYDGMWAAFKTYDEAIPRGFWVHSLEHGAVVIAYSCTDCEAEVEAAKTLIEELPVDPLCSSPVERRVILTPDPKLDTRWAASAWGFTLTSECFEAEVFRAFAISHNAAGPEDFCDNGVDVGATPKP
jgi:hypothetical protein